MSELANAEIVNLFASPSIPYRWPDSDELNKEPRQRVLAQVREYPGRSQSKSNVGGRHSETGQLEFGAAADKTLLRRATTFFPAFLPPGIFIRPEPGLMVLFPSYIPHMVFPHRGKRPRISIAFNFRKEPFP